MTCLLQVLNNTGIVMLCRAEWVTVYFLQVNVTDQPCEQHHIMLCTYQSQISSMCIAFAGSPDHNPVETQLTVAQIYHTAPQKNPT